LITEEEIDALLDKWIAKYEKAVGPLGDRARDDALDSVRSFLRQSAAADFGDADSFSGQVFDVIRESYEKTWTSKRATGAVERSTRDSYSSFRLHDETPFGGESPVKLRLGGPDKRAVEFFGKLDNFYFSRYLDNSEDSVKRFLRDEYLEKGAQLFGRSSGDTIDEFRSAAGGRLSKINDAAVDNIVVSSVQRVRNYAHINSLRQAKLELARIVATRDSRTSDICKLLDGKLLRVGVAAETIDRLVDLEPEKFAEQMYHSAAAREFASDPAAYVKDRVTDGVIDDDLVTEGRGFPPYHPRCRTRVEGVVPGSKQ
jgi:hypothetical protein